MARVLGVALALLVASVDLLFFRGATIHDLPDLDSHPRGSVFFTWGGTGVEDQMPGERSRPP